MIPSPTPAADAAATPSTAGTPPRRGRGALVRAYISVTSMPSRLRKFLRDSYNTAVAQVQENSSTAKNQTTLVISALLRMAGQTADWALRNSVKFLGGMTAAILVTGIGLLVVANVVPVFTGYYNWVQLSQSVVGGLNTISLPTSWQVFDLMLKDLSPETWMYYMLGGATVVVTSAPDKAYKVGQASLESKVRKFFGLADKSDKDFGDAFAESYANAGAFAKPLYMLGYLGKVAAARTAGVVGGFGSTTAGVLLLRGTSYLISTRYFGLARYGLAFTKEVVGAMATAALFILGKKVVSTGVDYGWDLGAQKSEQMYDAALRNGYDAGAAAIARTTQAAKNARDAAVNTVTSAPANARWAAAYVQEHGLRQTGRDVAERFSQNMHRTVVHMFDRKAQQPTDQTVKGDSSRPSSPVHTGTDNTTAGRESPTVEFAGRKSPQTGLVKPSSADDVPGLTGTTATQRKVSDTQRSESPTARLAAGG